MATAQIHPESSFGIASTLSTALQLPAKDGEVSEVSEESQESLEMRQREDPELKHVIDFLTDGTLPEDRRLAQEIVLAIKATVRARGSHPLSCGA